MSNRRDIRYTIAYMLTNALPQLNGRVFQNRYKKLFPSELPAIIIYSRSEQAEIAIAAPRQYMRTLRVAVEVYNKLDGAEDGIDYFCDTIEQTLFADETIGGFAADCILSDTELETNQDGDNTYACGRVTFEVKYWTGAPEDSDSLDDLLTVHSEMKPAPGLPDTPPAIDEIRYSQGSN